MERPTSDLVPLGSARANQWRVSPKHVSLMRNAAPPRPLSIAAEPQSLTFDLARSAFIVVDMQNDFCAKGGYLDYRGVDYTLDRRPIEPIRRIVPQLRAQAVPIVWLRRRPLEGNVRAKALVAVLSVAAVYAAALFAHWVFKTDFRFWVVALKPMALHHVPVFLAYVLPFTAFFYVSQRALHETLSLRHAGAERQHATGLVATAGGFAAMLAVLYGWLFATGHLPTVLGVDVLFTVIAIQFVPVLAVTGLVAVFTWRRTNGALTGALMCGLLVTWYIVAGQATHV